ncbi:MAG: putative lipid II flippase FtsW [Oscillospiraceae bacterium]|jgi:cell division protein FtsW|nr:putative lipid II flippase FtsW [Oscillospiraceae bacterium]
MATLSGSKRRTVDGMFVGIVISLVVIGLVMLWSASYVDGYYKHGSSWLFISRQLVFAACGVVAMFVISQIDYKIYFGFAEYIYGLAIFLLVVVLFMKPMNGARRWIGVGGFSFQPSEVAKFAVIVVISKFVAFNKSKMKSFKYGVLRLMVFMGLIAGLMIFEPHISGTVLIFSIGAVMMFVGGTNLFWFIMVAGFLVGVVLSVIFVPGLASYARPRLDSWLDPWADPQGRGYQIIQSLYAIGAGGIFGVGIGGSKQKQLYLPEPHNDFIFSVTCEECGFVGATAIIFLFVVLIYRGFQIAKKTQDDFGRMLTVGIVAHVGLQVIFNIAVVTNTIPSTGISMPFFSYGGTSLLMLLAEMGIVLSVDRFGHSRRIYRI